MRLTPEEEALLAGEGGEGARRAMRIVVTLGRIYDAERLLPVESVQVAGVSFRNVGEAGLEFLRDWAAQGAHVTVPATLNPAGMDMRDWRRMGISAEFARLQEATVRAYTDMGVTATCTCTPTSWATSPPSAHTWPGASLRRCATPTRCWGAHQPGGGPGRWRQPSAPHGRL